MPLNDVGFDRSASKGGATIVRHEDVDGRVAVPYRCT